MFPNLENRLVRMQNDLQRSLKKPIAGRSWIKIGREHV